jgi:hypothetical protein
MIVIHIIDPFFFFFVEKVSSPEVADILGGPS